MDLTPAFFDRWREHRELGYLDHVRAVFEEAPFDEPWLEVARLRAVVHEARATLRHAGIEVDEEAVTAIVDRGETGGLGEAELAAVRAYAAAHRAALDAAEHQAAITPALLDGLHAQLSGTTSNGGGTGGGALESLCTWLAGPPDELHPAVVAAVAHVELQRMRRYPDGNARLARLLVLLLLTRSGYGYRGLLSPSTHWSDPRALPATPAEELQPGEAETHPAVEHTVHGIAASVRDMVSWVRAEESAGSLQAMWFGWPLQP